MQPPQVLPPGQSALASQSSEQAASGLQERGLHCQPCHSAVLACADWCAPVQLLDGLVIVPSDPALQVHWVTSVAPSCDVLEPAGHAMQLADDAWPGCVLYVPNAQPAMHEGKHVSV